MSYKKLALRSQDENNSYHILVMKNETGEGGSIGIVRGAGVPGLSGGEGWLLSFGVGLPDISLKYTGLLCLANHRQGRMYSYYLQGEDFAVIEDLCLHIEKEMGGQLQMKEDLVRSLLMVSLMYLNRTHRGGGTGLDELVGQFFSLLDVYYTREKQPSEYASRLQVKPAYLNDVLKKNCGFTTSYLIQERIVEEAKSLGRHSDMNMKQISYRLGFGDVSHFSKYFKKFSGQAYSMYRQQAV